MSLRINDTTLRDGNHAASHKLTLNQITQYCQFAESVGIDYVEVGHGNGLGASSLQLGKSLYSDAKMLEAARSVLNITQLGVHVIPGFARLDDINMAIHEGADIFRIASHCTETDITQRYIETARCAEKKVCGALMMSHMISKEQLLLECKKMVVSGATAIVIMDSAGAYVPYEVAERISYLCNQLEVNIGFHAHNNLGLAIANSMAAIEAGASIVDVTLSGYGAGAGNTPLERMVAVLNKLGINSSINAELLFKFVPLVQPLFFEKANYIDMDTVLSGIYGVFSGFLNPVKKVSKKYKVPTYDIYKKLGALNVVAGQEDLIIEIAQTLRIKHENE